ncbi:MAG: polysaccharide deacetylase family protein [bacterium]|nr:polysaccharide deacetylase family protein [bacterium]
MRKLASFLWQSRGIVNLISRGLSIMNRFNFTPCKLEKILGRYIDLLLKYNAIPTFPITANIVDRYPETIQRLQKRGAVFEIHGYVHIDYTRLSLKQQEEHFRKAIEIFQKYKITFSGFRAPYTRWNDDTMEALKTNGFMWDSSYTMLLDIIDKKDFKKKQWDAYQKAVRLYTPGKVAKQVVTPRIMKNGIVEIPMTLPDDEIVVDRLGIRKQQIVKKILWTIFKKTYERGEFFGVQVHPERVTLYRPAIERILKQVEVFNLPVWKATLKDIAEWWIEKEKFEAVIKETQTNVYAINFKCSKRATVLAKNIETGHFDQAGIKGNGKNGTSRFVADPSSFTESANWYGKYKLVNSISELKVHSDKKPIIGINPNCSDRFVKFLKEDGYIVEITKTADNYSIYFNGIKEFDEIEILKQIEKQDVPLVRFWRWPWAARSVFSITGDVDALTIIDFWGRIVETHFSN